NGTFNLTSAAAAITDATAKTINAGTVVLSGKTGVGSCACNVLLAHGGATIAFTGTSACGGVFAKTTASGDSIDVAGASSAKTTFQLTAACAAITNTTCKTITAATITLTGKTGVGACASEMLLAHGGSLINFTANSACGSVFAAAPAAGDSIDIAN